MIVSGFVTSPYDHERICSGLARAILTWLKSLTSSIKVLFLRFEPHEVDAKLRHVRRRVVDKRDVPAFVVRYLDRKAEALQFLHEHLERLRHARFEHVLTLHDRFVCLDPA